MSDERFRGMMESGHVAVLPYLPPAFARRTSGLLVDALYFGLPVVVMEGTWLAGVVREYDCGKVVASMSSEAVVQAICDVVNRYEACHARTRSAAMAYFKRNSWRALAESVLRIAAPTDAPESDAASLSARRAEECRKREARLRQWRHEREGLLKPLRYGVYHDFLQKLVLEGKRRVALYGAGLFTRRLLLQQAVPEGLHIVCILDDAPRVDSLAGIPVHQPTHPSLPAFDAIVISSDTLAGALYRKACALQRAPVFTFPAPTPPP